MTVRNRRREEENVQLRKMLLYLKYLISGQNSQYIASQDIKSRAIKQKRSLKVKRRLNVKFYPCSCLPCDSDVLLLIRVFIFLGTAEFSFFLRYTLREYTESAICIWGAKVYLYCIYNVAGRKRRSEAELRRSVKQFYCILPESCAEKPRQAYTTI